MLRRVALVPPPNERTAQCVDDGIEVETEGTSDSADAVRIVPAEVCDLDVERQFLRVAAAVVVVNAGVDDNVALPERRQ